MRRRLTILTIFILYALPASAAQEQNAARPVIVTRGEATLKRAPDQAWVAIAAQARATTPAEAQQAAAAAMTSVRASLSRVGLAEDAIRTTGYSLQPDMEYVNGRSRVRGYVVNNQIEVRVDDLQKIGGVLDAAGGSGATSISSLRFDLKERAAAEREALRLAVQDAMARARALAAGAGATLGPVVRIDEHADRPMPGPIMALRTEAAQAASTPVTPGEIEIRGEVTLTVAIR